MKITFLGKDPGSDKDDCPSLYDTDRGTHLVQGWRVDDPAVHAALGLAAGEACVEVPPRLMVRLAGTGLPDDGQPAPVFVVTGRGTYAIKGAPVVDAEALAQMSIPAHETAVEVSTGLQTAMRGYAADL